MWARSAVPMPICENRTGFSIGSVSPVAHATPPVTLIDQDPLRFDVVWAAAGTQRRVPAAPQRLAAFDGAPVDVVQASAPQASGSRCRMSATGNDSARARLMSEAGYFDENSTRWCHRPISVPHDGRP